MKTELYTITTLSNLHVGSGDINFDIIDNQVQRDATTNLPIIHSSSLKGAFREHFTIFDENGKKVKDSMMVTYVFGRDTEDSENKKSSQAGAYSFFEAQLLTRPVRSNVRPYFNATSPSVIKNFLEAIALFDIGFDEELKAELERFSQLNPLKNEPLIFENLSNVTLEDEIAKYQNFDVSKLKSFLGENLALFEDKAFEELDLPVIARNQLENGKSKNLWYEEVVPKKNEILF